MAVGALAEVVGKSPAAVSQHLARTEDPKDRR
ncbi:DNA-binding transcriptional ArsR family regulator [Arthrobacter sp. UYEF6]